MMQLAAWKQSILAQMISRN